MPDLTEEEKAHLENKLVIATMKDAVDLIRTRINNYRSICNADFDECVHLIFIITTELTANVYSKAIECIASHQKEEFFDEMIYTLKKRIKFMSEQKT